MVTEDFQLKYENGWKAQGLCRSWDRINSTKRENKDETILLHGKAALPLTLIIPVVQSLSFAFYLLLDFFKLKCIKRPTEFNSVNTFMLYQTCNLT